MSAEYEMKWETGFTLIELMIVVAIIAIIAAIAIPNLLESRMQANETTAVACLKEYAHAQSIYQKANYSLFNLASPKQFCPSFANLGGAAAHTNSAGTQFQLIPDAFANATAANGFNGYFYTDSALVIEWAFDFGLYADPVVYEKSGVNSFYIGSQGTVLMKDLVGAGSGGAANTADGTWTIP